MTLPLVVLANGIGSRLDDVTAGSPKTMLRVGQTTMLGRLLRSARSANVSHTLVVVRSDVASADREVETAGMSDRTTVLEREPAGKLSDLVDLIPGYVEPPFVLVDSDLVLGARDFVEFVRFAASEPGRMVVGASILAPDAEHTKEPIVLRCATPVGPAARVLEAGRGVASATHLLTGIYAWSRESIRVLRDQLGRGSASTGRVIAAMARAAELDAFVLGECFNVNTRADLDAARRALSADPTVWGL